MQPFESRTSRRTSQSSQDVSSQQAPAQGASRDAPQGSLRKRKQMGIAGVSPVQHRPLSAKRPMGYSLRGQKQATSHRRGRGPRMGRSGAGSRMGARIGSRAGFGGILSTWRGRMIVFFGSILLIIILLVVGITSCVRSCTANKNKTVQATQQKKETAPKLSNGLQKRLDAQLETNKQLAAIAKNASHYANEKIIELALNEPAATSFVAAIPTADKKSQAYSDAITKGGVPALYTYDKRWGFVDYAGMPLGVTGSGPTCLSMAFMALTGSAEQTPATIAKFATDNGFATGDTYTDPKLFTSEKLADVKLSGQAKETSADNITSALKKGGFVIGLTKKDSLSAQPHYLIIAAVNADGTLTVYDPLSSSVSSRPWAMSTITNSLEGSIYVIKAAQQQAKS